MLRCIRSLNNKAITRSRSVNLVGKKLNIYKEHYLKKKKVFNIIFELKVKMRACIVAFIWDSRSFF